MQRDTTSLSDWNPARAGYWNFANNIALNAETIIVDIVILRHCQRQLSLVGSEQGESPWRSGRKTYLKAALICDEPSYVAVNSRLHSLGISSRNRAIWRGKKRSFPRSILLHRSRIRMKRGKIIANVSSLSLSFYFLLSSYSAILIALSSRFLATEASLFSAISREITLLVDCPFANNANSVYQFPRALHASLRRITVVTSGMLDAEKSIGRRAVLREKDRQNR